jgi:DNA-binding response OmpR family regulator
MAGILIVDDDPAFRSLAARLLEEAGVHVAATAEDAATALTSAHAIKPDAVLVDVGLPDRDAVPGSLQDGHPPFVPKEELPNAPLRQLLLGD